MSFWQKAAASSGMDDMVLLAKVDEQNIVENLKKRYAADLIYTYIGPTLVALNPYKKLNCFTEKEINQYHGAAQHENPPHIYAVADSMFSAMLSDEESQCVIISGESGAGKTESAKLIMNYIAAVSGRGTAVVEQVKRIILESNPLLEAFGNAKTLRNNNSSRFGKYFEIHFARGGQPIGGSIRNFLLEKSRVVGVAKGERNFHIFYQMTKAASPQEKEALGLQAGPQGFSYLNCSGTYDADGIDDAQEYAALKHAMEVCKISPENRQNMLNIVGAVLHLGNIEFDEENNAAQVRDPRSLAFPAFLLGVPQEDLKAKLTSRIIETGGGYGKRSSTYEVPLNAEQARGTRDALAKALYSRMFDFLVQSINSAMHADSISENLVMGVLDIYGFEIFDKNGFEQFCINYVNEKLQQIFISLTLQSEQEEYAAEGIQWTPIEYFNNKIVVDLIESKRPPGIMSVLDDVCFTMHAVTDGADETFVQKLDGAVSGNKHFQGQQNHFIIRHYAGDVDYSCRGFVESNKDTLFKDLVACMQGSTSDFIRSLFPENLAADDKKRPTTASMKIRNQSQDLVATLMKCVPSYVRCIKPNENKRPGEFDAARVGHQVRYLNLKENIKVRRAGFCYRSPFEKVLKRYAILTKETYPSWNGDPKAGIQHLMKAANLAPDQYQLGRTKLFIKAPESLFLLEELRERKYDGYARVIQRAWRQYHSRKQFIQLKEQSADIFYGKKERRRFSLNRDYIGDYIGYMDNPILRALVGRAERVIFASDIVKFDRKYRTEVRQLLITDKSLLIVGHEKAKSGQIEQTIKRRIPINQVLGVSLSTKCDDYVVIHAPDYDTFCECVFKTEMVSVLADCYLKATGRVLQLNFGDTMSYTVKKLNFFSGAGSLTVQFIPDPSAVRPTLKPGNKAEVRVAPGLSATSRPNPRTKANWDTALAGIKKGKVSNGTPYVQQTVPPPVVPSPMQSSAAPIPPPMPPPVPIAPSPVASLAVQNVSAPSSRASSTSPNPLGKKAPPPPPPKKKKQPAYKAVYSYQAREADELTFEEGDVLYLIRKEEDGWLYGTKQGSTKEGLFPENYVEEML